LSDDPLKNFVDYSIHSYETYTLKNESIRAVERYYYGGVDYGNGKMSYSQISRVPSENGTYGDAWDKRKQADFKEQQKKTTPEPAEFVGPLTAVDTYVQQQTTDTLNRVSTRIRSQWGSTLADSSNLKWMLNKTKAKF